MSLNCGLVVITPTGGSLLVENMHPNCIIRLGEYEFGANLIILDIRDFDAIWAWIGLHFTMLLWIISKNKLYLKARES